jgi:orotidine-5'-phosphate decarboxylase
MATSLQSTIKEKVIVALDYDNPEKSYRLVDELGDMVEWYKLGPTSFAQEGMELIRHLHKRRKKIFLDLKILDIPNVVYSTVKSFGDLGVDCATVHCIGGRKMLEAAGRGCRGTPLRLFGITLITSMAEMEEETFGHREAYQVTVERLTQLAVEARLSGILCSPNELKNVRPKAVPGFQFAVAGIRPKGREILEEDQARVSTPTQALEWGADFLIVGRPISNAREPRAAVESLLQ